MLQLMVEEHELAVLRRMLAKPAWDGQYDWFKTYAVSIRLTPDEANYVLAKLTPMLDSEEYTWGKDNIRIQSMRLAERTLKTKLASVLSSTRIKNIL